jgi:hypothetical protein
VILCRYRPAFIVSLHGYEGGKDSTHPSWEEGRDQSGLDMSLGDRVSAEPLHHAPGSDWPLPPWPCKAWLVTWRMHCSDSTLERVSLPINLRLVQSPAP